MQERKRARLRRAMVAAVAAGVMGGGAAWNISAAQAAGTQAVINNGTIAIGINNVGDLNVGNDGSVEGSSVVGLRYMPTTYDGISPGCPCEGWGVADAGSGLTGYANESTGRSGNLSVKSFVTTASTAVSVVDILDDASAPGLEVTHDYHPSAATPNLYQVNVGIKNVGTAAVSDLRYRRVMDWDIQPTAFNEYVTVNNGGAANVLFTSDNGFASANPLSGPSEILFNGNAVDSGPTDHGSLWDFGFGTLAPGATKSFVIYYGAADTEANANLALSKVGAEAYSYGQPGTDPDGKINGTPNTFIFAFGNVGGHALFEPCASKGLQGVNSPTIAKQLYDSTLKSLGLVKNPQRNGALSKPLGTALAPADPVGHEVACAVSLVDSV